MVKGNQILFDAKPIKIVGLRFSNALISDATTRDLIEALDLYRSYGVNTVSVFLMGSRFGDVKGYLPDASLNPVYRKRFERILRATQGRGMVTIVGCLYWSTSRAKEDLSHWTQEDADRAIANTARWLAANKFAHVILDPDNEGMAVKAKGWKVERLIRAAKQVNPDLVVANNTKQNPTNEDLNMHFGKHEKGKPWFDSEATPANTPGNYWGRFSKETHQADKSFYNYSRIGRYTLEMKRDQLATTRDHLKHYNGYVLASTWIQCGPAQGVGGPFTKPGGRSDLGSAADKSAAWNRDIDTIHRDAGILWWLEFVKNPHDHAGVDKEEPTPRSFTSRYFEEVDGVLALEAESFHRKTDRKPTNGTQKKKHAWTLETRVPGYSGRGYMSNLPDEQGENAASHHSPRDGSGAEMVYRVKINNAGTYHIWLRGRALGGESNGVHVQVDGRFVERSAGTNMSGFRPTKTWVWEHGHKEYASAPTCKLTEGYHTIHVYGRDDGFSLDKIVLARPPVTALKEKGPPESKHVD